MGFSSNSMILVLLLSFCGSCFGAFYKVGDSQGWTSKGSVDYKTWASTKQFQVGDVLNFEYDPQVNNVVRVTHKDYKSCNTSNSTFISQTGNDAIVIKNPGHLYFVCSVPGHCQAGQKVDIRVPPKSDIRSPSPTPTSSKTSPTASPPSSAPSSPTPSIKGGAPPPKSTISSPPSIAPTSPTPSIQGGAPPPKSTISSPPSPTAYPPSIAPTAPTPSINGAPDDPEFTVSSSPAPTPSDKKKSAAPSILSSKVDLHLFMAVLVVAAILA
ncbi:blue copper protein-like [Ziziphus jujuba]|uniref:Blue copper protein-like n=1 Tax=Ziziphus jujuba TaxID=326968 RepID=A0ABM4AHV7_ZIZJJ|nr:blue copper protein-like [Ziziphus jujuba]